jgi:hypothetical protein
MSITPFMHTLNEIYVFPIEYSLRKKQNEYSLRKKQHELKCKLKSVSIHDPQVWRHVFTFSEVYFNT